MFQLAISNIAWKAEEDEAVFSLMQQYGFTGLEIAPTRVWQSPHEQSIAALTQWKQSLESKQIIPAAFQALLYGQPDLVLFGAEEARHALAKHLGQTITLAGQLGVKALVFGSPKNRLHADLPIDEADRIASDFFKTIGDLALRANAFICLEPNPTAYGADYWITTEETLRFVRQLDHPGIRLNLDLGAVELNGEVNQLSKLIQTAGEFIGHMHLSSPWLSSLSPNQNLHQHLADNLQKIGYAGWVSVEMRRPEEDPLGTLESVLEFIARSWQP